MDCFDRCAVETGLSEHVQCGFLLTDKQVSVISHEKIRDHIIIPNFGLPTMHTPAR